MTKKAQQFKAERRCIKCGKQDERTLAGLIMCEECALAHRERNRERANRRRSAGKCIRCGAEDEYTAAGRSYCMECATMMAETQAARTVKLRDRRCCESCGAKLPDGHFFVLCDKCRERNIEYGREKRERERRDRRREE